MLFDIFQDEKNTNRTLHFHIFFIQDMMLDTTVICGQRFWKLMYLQESKNSECSTQKLGNIFLKRFYDNEVENQNQNFSKILWEESLIILHL
jgi:hypothetical protein